MTPDEAGAALAADPTFSTMSDRERAAEAAALLGGFATPSDDPLDIALAVAAAEALVASAKAVEAAVLTVPGVEPCRLNGLHGPSCGGNEPVAGNGRCMTCGAQRLAAALEHESAPEVPEPPKAPERAPAAPAAPNQRSRVAIDPEASFVGRFKEVTGCADREIALLLGGMARTTVTAYATGRLAEKLDVTQAKRMIAELETRQIILADLVRDLKVAVGGID